MAQEKTNTILFCWNKIKSCYDKINKAIGRNCDEVVHKLIYPALLGSMIYDMFDPDFSDNGYKIGIVIFYLLDYYHVFTFLDKKFNQIKKGLICVSIDCLVSVFLTLAYHFERPIFLCIIPLFFAPYAGILFKKKFLKTPIWILHIAFSIIAFCIYYCSSLNEVWLIYIMISLYFSLMLIEIRCSDSTNYEFIELKQESSKGNRYRLNITEISEDIFEKVNGSNKKSDKK